MCYEQDFAFSNNMVAMAAVTFISGRGKLSALIRSRHKKMRETNKYKLKRAIIFGRLSENFVICFVLKT